jgi:hypothetical protein
VVQLNVRELDDGALAFGGAHACGRTELVGKIGNAKNKNETNQKPTKIKE